MTLVDHETGQVIINPYIGIYDYPNVIAGVAMNTSTFGEEGQRNLLNIIDEKNYRSQNCSKGDWFIVYANIGKQDHPFDWVEKDHCERGVRMDISTDTLVSVTLGYLHKDFVQEHFPNTFKYIQTQKYRATSDAEHF